MPRIDPIEFEIAQLLGNEDITTSQSSPISPSKIAQGENITEGTPFDDILSKAVQALSDVSKTEAHANMLIDNYVHGRADLQDAMIATSKASVAVQLAVTVINSAVNTFKEITQMQV